jgi:hypothetical protein
MSTPYSDKESAMTKNPPTTIVYAVGKNLAGYMPEGDVYHTTDYASAKGALVEDLTRYGDDLFSQSDEHDCDDIPCPTFGDDCTWQLANDTTAAAEELNLCAVTDANGGQFDVYIGHLHFWLVAQSPEYFGLIDDETLEDQLDASNDY